MRRGGIYTPRRGGTRGCVHRGDRGAAVGRGGGEDLVVRQFHGARKGLRVGRNPKTGEPAAILPRRVVVFRASAKLKERINKGTAGMGEDA